MVFTMVVTMANRNFFYHGSPHHGSSISKNYHGKSISKNYHGSTYHGKSISKNYHGSTYHGKSKGW